MFCSSTYHLAGVSLPLNEGYLLKVAPVPFQSLLMKVKEESGKSWLKVPHSEKKDNGIWSHHFMANRWGNGDRLLWGPPNSTADGDYSHEIKRWLLLVRKAVIKLDSY